MVTPSLLASYLAKEAQSVVSLLQRMEARGFLWRKPHPEDGRSIVIQISNTGRRVLDECNDIVFQEVTNFFSPLHESSLADFEGMLRVLRDNTAEDLGMDVEKLDHATGRVERDPEMWTRAYEIREAGAVSRA